MRLKGSLHLNLWFHLGVPAKSVVIEQNHVLLKEQWVRLDVVVNVVKSVNTSLILLLVVPLEKHIKLIIV